MSDAIVARAAARAPLPPWSARFAAVTLAALALALAAAPVATPPALAGEASFSIGPIRLELAAEPGRPTTDAIEIANDSGETAHFRVYPEDWRLERDGAVTFARPGGLPRSASTWVRVNPTEFDLPPHAVIDIRFTVTVPKGAPAGGYRTAIVVEQVPRPSVGGTPIRRMALRARIASVVYLTVGDPVPSASIEGLSCRRRPNGARELVLAVRNRGAVHFRTHGQVALLAPGTGKPLHRLDLPNVPVLPESLRDVRIPLPDAVAPGLYQVRTDLDVGRRELYTDERRLVIE